MGIRLDWDVDSDLGLDEAEVQRLEPYWRKRFHKAVRQRYGDVAFQD